MDKLGELKSSFSNTLENVGDLGNSLLLMAMSILTKDPVGGISEFFSSVHSAGTLRDAIFLDSFKHFLSNLYMDKQNILVDMNIKAFSEVLAEASPNRKSGYQGNPRLLEEYAKRLIVVIDECGTIKKSEYIANLGRAVINGVVDTATFFRLCRCVVNLTEEDLAFIRDNVSEDKIETDEEYIDDFRALGLLKEVDGGFDYTKRAFQLKKFALDYEGNTKIPETFRERQIMAVATDADIDNVLNNIKVEDEVLRIGNSSEK